LGENEIKTKNKNINFEELEAFNLARNLATIKFSQDLLPSNAYNKILVKYKKETPETEK
jgi:hypothetical protein